ncbi:hypothetical protein HDU96_009970, partial [Phlyctochytrium bullatum]
MEETADDDLLIAEMGGFAGGSALVRLLWQKVLETHAIPTASDTEQDAQAREPPTRPDVIASLASVALPEAGTALSVKGPLEAPAPSQDTVMPTETAPQTRAHRDGRGCTDTATLAVAEQKAEILHQGSEAEVPTEATTAATPTVNVAPVPPAPASKSAPAPAVVAAPIPPAAASEPADPDAAPGPSPARPASDAAGPAKEYILKAIDWKLPGSNKPMKRVGNIMQNENGPCPLLALCAAAAGRYQNQRRQDVRDVRASRRPLTDLPTATAQQLAGMDPEALVGMLASLLASTVTFDPEENVPVVMEAADDGIRVVVNVNISNPDEVTRPLRGLFDLDLHFASHPIGHLRLPTIRLPPHETHPHPVHVLFAPPTPDAMVVGGPSLGLLAADTERLDGGVCVKVGVTDLGSLVRGHAEPETLQKVLWDAIHSDAAPATPPSPAFPGAYPTTPAPPLLPPLRALLATCLDATRVPRSVPAPLAAGLRHSVRFRVPGHGFSVGTAARARAVAQCQLRNPFDADVTVLHVVARARVPTPQGWRTVGGVDATFGVPASLAGAAGRPHVPDEPMFVIPYTTLDPRVAMLSPLVNVDAAVDCRAFGSLVRATRRRLEDRVSGGQVRSRGDQ